MTKGGNLKIFWNEQKVLAAGIEPATSGVGNRRASIAPRELILFPKISDYGEGLAVSKKVQKVIKQPVSLGA